MSLVKIAALFETSLQNKITAAATTMTLVSGTDKDGNALSGLYGFVINEGASNEEFVIGTVSGTTVSGLLRKISVSNPNTTGTGLSHRRGETVKITNYPVLGFIWRILNGTDAITNLLKYASELTPSGDYDIVYKKWVEDRNGYWTGAVANYVALPIGAVEGEARVTLDDGKIYVWDVATATAATIDSIDLGTNVITMTGAHGLSTGDYIYFATSDTLPAGLALNTAYYVYVDSATEIHVSLTIAGATVDITDAGTGTHTVKEASWVLAGAGGGAGTVYVTNKLGTGADDAPTNTTFSLNAGSWPDQKYLQVYLNGVLQEYGASEDYTVADSNTIIFNTSIADTDKVTLLVVSIDLYNPAWGAINASLIPDTHNTYDLGSNANRFKDLYLEGNADIDGTLNVEGVATFQALPVIPETPTIATNPASKGYVDKRKAINITANVTDAPTNTSENTLYTFTLPANSLGTTGALRITIPGSLSNGGNGNITLRLKIGSTTIASLTQTVNNPQSGSVYIVAMIVANGATNAQVGSIQDNWCAMVSAAANSQIGSGTAAEDSTGNLTVTLTAQWASTPGSLTLYSGVAELLNL